ncbi:MAG: purple acid phosphatase family protein [Promethearchaeota archaeon]
MKDKENIFEKIFILTAVFSITTPIILILCYQYEISNAFFNLFSDVESILWVLGMILGCILFGLLGAYMIFNKLKNNITSRSKILAVIFLPILIIGSGIGAIYFIGTITPEDRGPYLSWMDDPKTTMTISFERKISDDYEVKYGKSENNLNLGEQFDKVDVRVNDGYFHYSVELTNLDPDTRYYYNIPGFIEEINSFKTAPDNNDTDFKFFLYGDSREENTIFDNQHIRLITQMLETHDIKDISFVINTGDLSGEYNHIKQWNIHFNTIKPLSKSIPYMVASGNHEWNPYDFLELKDQPALDIQDFPVDDNPDADVYSLDEVSYSFGFSNSFFIFLGYPHVGYEFDEEDEYLEWLEDQLAIGNESYDFTFVSLHRPPFDDREGEDEDDNKDVIKRECPLFHKYGVEAVFCGHNHVLAHQKIKWEDDPNERTVHYIISGGGGAPLRNPEYGKWDNDYDMGFYGKTVFAKGVNHYHLVEIDAEKGEAKFTAYELGGEMLEEFTINAYNKH